MTTALIARSAKDIRAEREILEELQNQTSGEVQGSLRKAMTGVIRIALTFGHLKGTHMKSLKRYAQVGMMAGTVLGSRTDVIEPVEVLEDANRSLFGGNWRRIIARSESSKR